MEVDTCLFSVELWPWNKFRWLSELGWQPFRGLFKESCINFISLGTLGLLGLLLGVIVLQWSELGSSSLSYLITISGFITHCIIFSTFTFLSKPKLSFYPLSHHQNEVWPHGGKPHQSPCNKGGKSHFWKYGQDESPHPSPSPETRT